MLSRYSWRFPGDFITNTGNNDKGVQKHLLYVNMYMQKHGNISNLKCYKRYGMGIFCEWRSSTCLFSVLLYTCKLWLPSLIQTTRGNGHTFIARKHVTRCHNGDQCKKTSQFKTKCKGDISNAFETAKITVFYPTVCKTPDVPLQNELLCWILNFIG